tara:strand:+ start:899 stop:1027 length:129 start_codon:yes stop_codon:yes gene_type:complete
LKADAGDQTAFQQSLSQGFSPPLIAFSGQSHHKAGRFSHGLI